MTEFKVLTPYLKLADEFKERDPILSYWITMHAIQRGIKTPASKTKEGKTYLLQKMEELEARKKAIISKFEETDAISDDIVAEAYCEAAAIKVFSWADGQDRSCNFGKPVIRAFYTASSLFEVLGQFGDLPMKAEELKKYSKVKAVYLSRCLKTGETPVPGNPEEDTVPLPVAPQTISSVPAPAQPVIESAEGRVMSTSGVPIQSDLMIRLDEHVSYARSAIQYEDVKTAVTFLQRALSILTTGQDITN
ncbi:Vacuolar protein sorting-associated protein VTA1-like protein isoform X2 [Oopsacas minuta]|uniref:Vacuolar protein sorting-associated protein VTA1-like protein isoform X2 n=1 Tax=Oopsacas minuta TaxID=111878 RepID=A0AAV7JJE8_9METZ|nr:Vacuolar protein sorting-associated protein VTA1-like protein isoform X2 [Oopsacas minuta]